MTALLIGLGIVWMCERYSFGCAITLFPDRLVYSDRGFLFGRKISIERGSILGAVYRRQINSDNLPWERVEVTYRDRDSEARTQVLSVVTFRRFDVERILQWLPNASGHPKPR